MVLVYTVAIVLCAIALNLTGQLSDILQEAADEDVFSIFKFGFVFIIGFAFFLLTAFAGAYLNTGIFNLAVGSTSLDGRHRLGTLLSPWPLVKMSVVNLLLMVVTVGLYYPCARVRISKYYAE